MPPPPHLNETPRHCCEKRRRGDRHIPERLVRIFTWMLEDGRLRKIDGWTTGPERPVPEGVWSTGGDIELPCSYVLHGEKESRKHIRECLHDSSSKKLFQKLIIDRTLVLLLDLPSKSTLFVSHAC